MNGGESQSICYLGKIVMIFPYHLFSKIHLHSGKVFNGTVAASGSEKLLELGAAYRVTSAELFDGQGFADMKFHIFLYLGEKFSIGFLFDRFHDSGIDGLVRPDHIAADQLDQQLIEIKPD